MEQNFSAVALTQQLVQIDSTNPGAFEKNMERFLCSLAEELSGSIASGACKGHSGVRPVEIWTEEVSPGRNNVMLVIPGKTKKQELIFICHMDTVPVGNGWTMDPFLGEIVDGRLYGRGSCDMKSGLACALSAFCSMAKRCRDQGMPERTIKLIGTVDEEGDMAGVEQAIRSGWVSKKSLVLDMEPTNGEIQAAHKGRTWFEIVAEGIGAHASTPWKGADAIASMAEVITTIRKEVRQLGVHPQMGAPTVSFGRISGGSQPYVVSDQCIVTVDMRLVPPYTSIFAQKIVEKAAQEAMKAVPKTKISWSMTGDRPCIDLDADSVLLSYLRNASKRATGKMAETGIFNGYTDTAVIAGKLGNHNCMSYGPGNLELAHKPDEYVPVEDILRCEKVLLELICMIN